MPDPLRRFAERTLPAWQELLQTSSREEDRYQALQAISALAEPRDAVRWMIQGLHDADSSLRAAAARWLANQADSASRPGTEDDWDAIRNRWQELWTDDDPDVRFESARGGLLLEPADQTATTVLLTFLNDAETQPVMLAAVLKALSPGRGLLESPAVHWSSLLQHAQAEVREHSARLLGLRGDRSPASAHELLPLLDDDEPFVREEAARALGQLGVLSPPIRGALDAAAADEDAIVAEQAQLALQRLENSASAS